MGRKSKHLKTFKTFLDFSLSTVYFREESFLFPFPGEGDKATKGKQTWECSARESTPWERQEDSFVIEQRKHSISPHNFPILSALLFRSAHFNLANGAG